MIAAAVALAAATAAPALLSGPDAYRLGLEKVCLPVANGANAAAIARELRLQPLTSDLLPGRVSPADRGWYLPTADITLAVAWADGSCSVQRLRGDPASLSGVMESVLRPRPERFSPGRMEAPAPDLRRVSYCEAKRPHPLMVTMVTAAPGAKNRMAASSTVMRSKNPEEPPYCVFNGVQ